MQFISFTGRWGINIQYSALGFLLVKVTENSIITSFISVQLWLMISLFMFNIRTKIYFNINEEYKEIKYITLGRHIFWKVQL